MATSHDRYCELDDGHHGLDAAIKSNLVPCKEYFLQGSVLNDHVQGLLGILKGLCDNAEDPIESFEDHEMCFIYESAGAKALRLRVLRSLKYENNPYKLRYVGVPEMGDEAQPTIVRTSIDVGTTNRIISFLQGLNYEKEFEFIWSGYLFKKGRMKITVAKIVSVHETQRSSSHLIKTSRSFWISDRITRSYLVETSIIEPPGSRNIGTAMRRFADTLKPFVCMEKVDQFRPF